MLCNLKHSQDPAGLSEAMSFSAGLQPPGAQQRTGGLGSAGPASATERTRPLHPILSAYVLMRWILKSSLSAAGSNLLPRDANLLFSTVNLPKQTHTWKPAAPQFIWTGHTWVGDRPRVVQQAAILTT